jgi:hypothetical protein
MQRVFVFEQYNPIEKVKQPRKKFVHKHDHPWGCVKQILTEANKNLTATEIAEKHLEMYPNDTGWSNVSRKSRLEKVAYALSNSMLGIDAKEWCKHHKQTDNTNLFFFHDTCVISESQIPMGSEEGVHEENDPNIFSKLQIIKDHTLDVLHVDETEEQPSKRQRLTEEQLPIEAQNDSPFDFNVDYYDECTIDPEKRII